jgi:CRISPR system Cascade subunit CasA
MTYSFNMIDQAWIPCMGVDGDFRESSLRQTLSEAHQLSGIVGSTPLETAALYRLLLAVLHSALRGPESAAAWVALWRTAKWDEPWLHEYLDRWKYRFDLFDPEQPFYQSRDDRVKTKSIINLVMDMASGNNAVLFDHHTESGGAVLSSSQAARLLITVQTFGLAGLCDPQKKLNFTDAPWARGIVFLVEGDNLFETLAMNLLRYDVDKSRPIPGETGDRPAWESDDSYQPERDVPRGYLDYLTWQNRRIVLIPEGDEKIPVVQTVSISPGLRSNSNTLDPMKHYRKDDKFGTLVLKFSEDRALWRDSAALFRVHSTQEHRPPLNFGETADRFSGDRKHREMRFMALGMANDQAKIEFFRHEHLPLPLDYLEKDELVGQLSTALQWAEEARRKLIFAAKWLAVLTISPKEDGKKWKDVNRINKEQATLLTNYWAVERFYWSELELPFLQLMEDLPQNSDEALGYWEGIVQRAAWKAMDAAANLAGETPKALKAAVRARAVLGGGLTELFPGLKNKELPV